MEMEHFSRERPLKLIDEAQRNKEKSEIEHEGHHHPLTFVERSSLFDCDACGTKQEDVSYRCTTCPFWIHKTCASAVEEYLNSDLMNFPLPDKSVDAISRYVKLNSLEAVNNVAREIFHPSHEHLLIRLDVQSEDAEMINTELCIGCSGTISVPFYTCGDCNFFLHKSNLILQSVAPVCHRLLSMNGIITRSPYHIPVLATIQRNLFVKFARKIYTLTTGRLYHCHQCDQSFHTKCINFDWYENVKFGGTLQVKNHSHPLLFVRKSKSKFPSICSQCGKSRDDMVVLECAHCNFQLCPHCCYRIVESLPSTS
ncbi:hypothetical protein LguiA_012751 [Lonicera macranthoides]